MGTHPIFESDFDCLTVWAMLSRRVLQSTCLSAARRSNAKLWTLGRLNHVAIAVPDLDESTAFYRDTLGAEVSGKDDLPEHGVTTVFVNLPNTKLELLHRHLF